MVFPKLNFLAEFLFVLLFLSLLVISEYLLGSRSSFMIDDYLFLNDSVRNIHNILAAFDPASTNLLYRPVPQIVVRLEYFLFGMEPTGYCLVSGSFFVLAAVSIYFFVKRVFENSPLAILTSSFFAVHPINHHLVNYFTDSYVSLEVIFTLGCLFWGAFKPLTIRNFFLAAVFFFLALACHETAVIIPIYVFIFVLVIKREPWLNAVRRGLGLYLLLGLYIVFRCMTSGIGNHLLNQTEHSHLDLGLYAAGLVRLVNWYLTRLVYPAGITVVWSTYLEPANIGISLAIGFLWILVWSYLYWRSKRLPAAKLGLWWLMAGFLPVTFGCLHISSRNLMIEPYWMAFSSIGFFLFLSTLFVEASKELKRPKALAGVLVLVLLWMTAGHIYNQMWANDKVYGFYYVQNSGDFVRSKAALANVFFRNKEFIQGGKLLKESYAEHLLDDLPKYYADQGFMDLNMNKLDAAKENFLKALALAPRYYECYISLGGIAFEQNDIPLAEKYYLLVIRNDPTVVLPRIDMGIIYGAKGETAKAIEILKSVFKIDPYSEMARVELLKIYLGQKDTVRTLEISDELLKSSHNPVVLRNIGLIYQANGRQNSAQEAFKKLQQIIGRKAG